MDRLQKSKRPSFVQGGGVAVYNGQVTFTSSNIYGNTAGYVSARLSPCDPSPQWISDRPMDKLQSFLLQGGGVSILGGTVTFKDVDIYGNKASNFVSARFSCLSRKCIP